MLAVLELVLLADQLLHGLLQHALRLVRLLHGLLDELTSFGTQPLLLLLLLRRRLSCHLRVLATEQLDGLVLHHIGHIHRYLSHV